MDDHNYKIIDIASSSMLAVCNGAVFTGMGGFQAWTVLGTYKALLPSLPVKENISIQNLKTFKPIVQTTVHLSDVVR